VQPLTADPRTAYTPAQITSLLTAPDLAVDYGVELLTPALALVADISADVAGGTVRRDNLANVHGTVDLTITRALAWGAARVRPYQLMSSATAGVSGVRFNLGVFLVTTPSTPLAETPITYSITGFDQIYLLQAPINDSYFIASGSNVLTAVKAALTSAGIVAPVLLDSSASAAVLASDLVFPLTSSESPTWIVVVNKLLASITYWGIWVDQDGAFRSGPYLVPASRPSEWTLTVGSLTTGIVSSDRTVVNDLWSAPNRWVFIRNGLPSAPTAGAGSYTVDNVSVGLSSQTSVGRVVPAPAVFLDAVDQANLQAQGDAIVAAAKRTTEVITCKLSPFPIAGHFDILTYSDAALGADRKVQCRSWSLPLDGSDMDYLLETVV
jgi:hypothetical protein